MSTPATGTAAITTSTRPSRAPAPASAAANWTALARGLDGKLVRPSDATYKTARQLYNTRFDALKPAAVAYVANETDIQECLAFARAQRTPVAIRNGGHSYAGWSSGNGRLVIDISKLAQVKPDGTIGAGSKLIAFYQGLARNRRTMP
ncbi:FAD-binding protein, partial [Streptomyces sp. SID13588]|uniref:FAD-binding protein n=1 Tax=Streptomyces sp. SID13588 TaxID=2706051 RepID=UPI0031BAA550